MPILNSRQIIAFLDKEGAMYKKQANAISSDLAILLDPEHNLACSHSMFHAIVDHKDEVIKLLQELPNA